MDDALLAQVNHGVLVTLKRDGRAQLSNVTHVYDPATRLIRISVTAPRAKTKNLQRDPRASYHVTTPDFWHYLVADATAELTPVATDPHDATVEELIDVYRRAAGKEHPDWDEYRRAMVDDQRLVPPPHVERVYGMS